jgi:colanic acid biosynthesis glycosyl transferase WcaI
MRILLISLNYIPEQTGIGKYQGEMGSWLVKEGHDVRAITAPPYYPQWKVQGGHSGWLYKTENIDGVRVYRIPLYVPAAPSGVKRLIHHVSFAVFAAPVLLWQAVRWKPEAILLTAPPLMVAPVALLAKKLSKVPTFLHVQDFEVDAAFHLGLLKQAWLYRFALKMESKALRTFSGVSTISRNMRLKLLEKGVKDERAFLVPIWANIHDFSPEHGAGNWPERLKMGDPDALIVLYSGNLGRKQGLETIVEAASLLQNHPHIRFVISGDGAGKADMERQAQGLTNVTFLPVQPMKDFIHLMIAADIHLLPQKAGAADLVMPSKLGNILASGRPVVVGAAAGTQVYDAVSGCGLIVPPEESKAFAKAIIKLADDKHLRERLGQEGIKRANEQWSKDSAMRRFVDIFTSKMSNRK